MPSAVTVRPATSSDLAAVVELAEASTLRAGASTDGGFLVSAFAPERYAAAQAAGQLTVATSDGVTLGFLLVYTDEQIPSDDRVSAEVAGAYGQACLIVKQVCVSPAARGRGVGAALYRHVATEPTAVFAAVVAEPFNAASVAFHERCGWKLHTVTSGTDGRPRLIYRLDPSA